MKKVIAFLMMLLLGIVCASCGNVSPSIQLGDSALFTETEIQSAADIVVAKFADLQGCTMTNLWYDETASQTALESYKANGKALDKANSIVLFCNFKTSAKSGAFEPNDSYQNYRWILTREQATDDWSIKDSGY